MHDLTCDNCGEKFSRKDKGKGNHVFCSNTCSAAHRRIHRRKRIVPKEPTLGGDFYLQALRASDGIFEDIQEKPQSAFRIGRPVAVERSVSTAALVVGHG